MSEVNIGARTLESLIDESGVPELEEYLTGENIPILDEDGERVVPSSLWKKFLAGRIRSGGCVSATNGVMPPTDPVANRRWSQDPAWSDSRKRRFATHPSVAKLLDGFASYVSEHEPDATIEQHAWTLTFVMPGGRWAGLKPQVKGLRLYAKREGRELQERVMSPADFEMGLAWLRNLPGYASSS